MSREIKFRVWDNLRGCYANRTNVFLSQGALYYRHWGEEEEREVISPYDHDDIIIELYTGLEDKNGKEICEGDIIKDTSDGDCLINAVFWCEKGGFWGVKPRSPFADRDWGWFIGRDSIEVIGNIHENPEILGDEK